MTHMVIFRNADGKADYHQASALEEAVRFVEQLRNEDQGHDARIFAMQEIPFEFRTVYQVELLPATGTDAPAPTTAEANPVEAGAPAPAETAEPVAANGARLGRLGRG